MVARRLFGDTSPILTGVTYSSTVGTAGNVFSTVADIWVTKLGFGVTQQSTDKTYNITIGIWSLDPVTYAATLVYSQAAQIVRSANAPTAFVMVNLTTIQKLSPGLYMYGAYSESGPKPRNKSYFIKGDWVNGDNVVIGPALIPSGFAYGFHGYMTVGSFGPPNAGYVEAGVRNGDAQLFDMEFVDLDPAIPVLPPAHEAIDWGIWKHLYATAKSVGLNMSAYGLNPGDPTGAATQMSGEFWMPVRSEASDVAVALSDPHQLPTLINPDLLTGGDTRQWIGLAMEAAGTVEIDPLRDNLHIDLVTYDGSTRNRNTAIASILGDVKYIRGTTQLLNTILKYATAYLSTDLQTKSDIDGTIIGDVTYADKAFPFRDSTVGDMLRQATTALGLYLHIYSFFDPTDDLPVVYRNQAYVSGRPYRYFPGGLQNFKRRQVVAELTDNLTVYNYNSVGYSSTTSRTIFYAADQTYQVEAGAVQEFSIDMGHTPYWEDPINGFEVPCLSAIPAAWINAPLGTIQSDGGYVVMGNDGYVVSPQRWADNGGSINIRKGNTSTEVIITITASNETALGPFTIAELDFPALYLASYGGVTVDRQPVTLGTGRAPGIFDTPDDPPSVPPEIDNPFFVSLDQIWDRTGWAVEQYGGPTWEADFQFVSMLQYEAGTAQFKPLAPESVLGSIFYYDSAYWRITTLQYNPLSGVPYSGTAEQHTRLVDVENDLGSLTLDQYQTILNQRYPNGVTLDVIAASPLINQPEVER